MISSTIDPVRRLATWRASGRVSFLDVAQAVQCTLDTHAQQSEFDSLFVLADLSAFYSCADLAALKPLVQAWGERFNRSRWAVVLPNETTREITDAFVRALNLRVDCFDSEAEAIEWIGRRASVTFATSA